MIYHSGDTQIVLRDESLLEANFFEEIDRWKTHDADHSIKKFKSSGLSDTEYERAKHYLVTMRETEEYDEYKKSFDSFCKFCHILPRGVIIRKYSLEKGKPDHHTLYVEYAYNTKQIELPEGSTLYHMSSVDGITELKPFFKGKSARGFLYDKPRIYFTIRKNMPKFLADYKINEKMHMYVCKENIRKVYVDPLVWSNLQGAVYVETNKPIKVEQVTKATLGDLIKKITEKPEKEKISNESACIEVEDYMTECAEDRDFDFDDFFGFVTENGLKLSK